jgi:hypothetical protein
MQEMLQKTVKKTISVLVKDWQKTFKITKVFTKADRKILNGISKTGTEMWSYRS